MAELVASGSITDDLFASAAGDEFLVGHGLADATVHGLLATTTAIWHNGATGQPVRRSLLAYDH